MTIENLKKICDGCSLDVAKMAMSREHGYAGLCNIASFMFARRIMDATNEEAHPYLFWRRHVACLCKNLVIDMTPQQFGECKNFIIEEKNDYIYWLCGKLYERGFFALVTEWDVAEESGKVIKLNEDNQRDYLPEWQIYKK